METVKVADIGELGRGHTGKWLHTVSPLRLILTTFFVSCSNTAFSLQRKIKVFRHVPELDRFHLSVLI